MSAGHEHEGRLAARGVRFAHPVVRHGARPVPALRGVDLHVDAGETVGLVGSSGSGKSTLLRLLLALEPIEAGAVTWQGEPVVPGRVRRLRGFRRAVQWVPQDPAGSLDPRISVHRLIADPLRRLGVPGDHDRAVRDALAGVHLDDRLRHRRPAELSGGQAQRVAIARAVATGCRVLLADEPVSGLDLPLRDQVLDLLAELSHLRGLGVLLVSHDLHAVARLCARSVVLADGLVVEQGPTSQLLRAPAHAETQALVAAVPTLPTLPVPTPSSRSTRPAQEHTPHEAPHHRRPARRHPAHPHRLRRREPDGQ